MNHNPDEYLDGPNFKGFKIMHNGPNHFEIPLPRGKANLRTRAGSCMNLNKDINAFVSLDLAQHEPHIDGYIFMIIEWSSNKCIFVGWILFDELLEKGKAFLEDETIYLAIQLKNLRSPKEFDKYARRKKKHGQSQNVA